MASRKSPREGLAAEAWGSLWDYFMSTRWQRDLALKRLSLTPNDARALAMLDGKEGKTMRSLADAWSTDASNVTFMVDRLEKRGLVERRTIESDRRVKLIVLTPRGEKTKADLVRAIRVPPPELSELDPKDLAALAEIMKKLASRANRAKPPRGGER